MRTSGHLFLGIAIALCALAPSLGAQEKELLPPADRAPQLILVDAGKHTGPRAPVTALAFSPNASTLYVGGFDKQVRRYDLKNGKYVATTPLRVPIGPGNAGVVNAIAVSADGKWVAVAGRAPIREETWAGADDGIYDEDFRLYPPRLRRDSGIVYLFDSAKPDGGKVIRGPQSEVRALAFANPAPATGPVLVTAGVEWNEKLNAYAGTVRAFNATTGAEIAARSDLPATKIPPGVAAWATGAKNDGLRVAVAWDAFDDKTGKLLPSKLLTWDNPGKNAEKSEWDAEALLISPLAVRIGKDGTATELLNGGYDAKRNTGGLNVRPATGGEIKTTALKGENERLLLPNAIAAFNIDGTGDATALLLPVGSGANGRRYELRLLTPKGQQSVTLEGFHPQQPVLGASPDGRFVAVAGFKDDRVEVYSTAALVTGKPVVETLAGDARGFDKIAFLVGEKLWLGRTADAPETGGVVLDLDRASRVAAPRLAKDNLKIDAPAGAVAEILKPDPTERFSRRVSVVVVGETKVITLPFGQQVTAAALLPGKPAWDATLGPVVAIAHVHELSQTVLVTLYDPITAKPVYKLGGPTLPIKSLAFSGSRALLAGAGADGTVAVWSLKSVSRKFPAIEGIVITAREGELVVASVQPKSAADGKLKADDVIESVADAKGVQKPVKTMSDFLLAVRTLEVGANAQIKVKGKPVVAVAVGAGTGFRHPLFTLWVDPEARDGKHDWVGWTSSGPYDSNGEAGESRIGWLTATGDPARPVTFSGANQYRKLFYTPDFLRLLLKTADYNEALAERPQPRKPALTAVFVGTTELRDGLTVVRDKLDGVDVTLNDPDRVLDLDKAELVWQSTGPSGASEWKTESFAAGRVRLDFSKHDWKRGQHSVHIKLVRVGEPKPVTELTPTVWFFPPPPVLAVTIDGKVPAPGTEITTESAEVEVGATVDAKNNPDGSAVTLSWTDGKPVELARNPNGTFAPAKVPLKIGETTVIRVTATNRGEGVKADIESHAIEARVRRLAPKMVPPPAVKLTVLSSHDFRTVANAPFVVSEPTAALTVAAQGANPITAIEWKIGSAEWQAGKLDPKTNSETRDVPLPPAGQLLVVQVRAKSKDSPFATDTVVLRFDGLPEVTVTMPPALVTIPELNLAGGLKVTGKRDFKVRVIVTSSRTGRTREFDPTPDAARTKWDAGITLFPGENQLGYVVTYDGDRKEQRRTGLIEVRYVRPPLVVGAVPVDVGTGAVGDVTLAVISPRDVAPSELWVNSARSGFRAPAKPVSLFGVGLWVLRAEGVPVNAGADRLKPVPVVVRNAESESQPVAFAVRGQQEIKVPPPTIRLAHKDNPIAPDQGLQPVGDPNFAFDLKMFSETKFTRIEVWHGVGASAGLERVDGAKLADAVAIGGGFEISARVTLKLRPGTANYVRAVGSNSGGTTTTAFNISYVPPPVRVVLDAIREPNGKVVPLAPGSELALTVDKSVIDVEGRVLWTFDDESVAQDRNLTVVFVVNGVAHLPVPVAPAAEGKERKFSGRIYLNTLDPDPKAPGVARVRAELRSGSRPVAIPQEGLKQAGFVVTSKDPLRRQRLHVLVVGVEVPVAEHKELVRRVVKAVGGEVPADEPNFTEGRFAREGFEFAYLYSPRLGYTKAGDLNALLSAARTDIERRTKRAGEDWVNDVIVVYYQGEDWVDKETGRWLLHSATTLNGAGGKNPSEYAIRLDNLPQIPGMPVAVVNVASTAKPNGNLVIDLPFLRYAWGNTRATGELLPQIALAIRAERTVEQMAKRVSLGLDGAPVPQRPSRIAFLPDEVLARVIGLKKP